MLPIPPKRWEPETTIDFLGMVRFREKLTWQLLGKTRDETRVKLLVGPTFVKSHETKLKGANVRECSAITEQMCQATIANGKRDY